MNMTCTLPSQMSPQAAGQAMNKSLPFNKVSAAKRWNKGSAVRMKKLPSPELSWRLVTVECV